MKKSNLILFILLSVVLGVLVGITVSICQNLNSKDVFSPDNNFHSSGDLSNISGDLDNNTSSITSGDTSIETEQNKKLNYSEIKAVYLTGWSAGSKTKRQSVIENLNEYGFNAVVIDIKDEAGQLSYKSNVQTAIDTAASKNMISNIENVIQEFHDAGIYVIGRIVTFKDPNYAKKITENAYKKADGSLWKDYAGNNWPNPYNPASWEYPIALAKEAATLGFDEIQFDYIRFPSSEGKTSLISFGFTSDTQTKSDIINSFLHKVMEELSSFDVVVSADVFGITTKKLGDFEHIGQDFLEIAKIVDVICPMVYPSHYGYGEYGIQAPDTKPYHIVHSALSDALKLYSTPSGDFKTAKIRPYLQDFTASWLKKDSYILYDTDAVAAQLQACYDLDIHDFILWDPNNKYGYDAINLIKESTPPDVSGDNVEKI